MFDVGAVVERAAWIRYGDVFEMGVSPQMTAIGNRISNGFLGAYLRCCGDVTDTSDFAPNEEFQAACDGGYLAGGIAHNVAPTTANQKQPGRRPSMSSRFTNQQQSQRLSLSVTTAGGGGGGVQPGQGIFFPDKQKRLSVMTAVAERYLHDVVQFVSALLDDDTILDTRVGVHTQAAQTDDDVSMRSEDERRGNSKSSHKRRRRRTAKRGAADANSIAAALTPVEVVPGVGCSFVRGGFFFFLWATECGEKFGRAELRMNRKLLELHHTSLHVPLTYFLSLKGRSVSVMSLCPVSNGIARRGLLGGRSTLLKEGDTPEVQAIAHEIISALFMSGYHTGYTAANTASDKRGGGASTEEGAAAISRGLGHECFLPPDVQPHLGGDGRIYFIGNTFWTPPWPTSRFNRFTPAHRFSNLRVELLVNSCLSRMCCRSLHPDALITDNSYYLENARNIIDRLLHDVMTVLGTPQETRGPDSILWRFREMGFNWNMLGLLLQSLLRNVSPPQDGVKVVKREMFTRGIKAYIVSQLVDPDREKEPREVLASARRFQVRKVQTQAKKRGRMSHADGDDEYNDEKPFALSMGVESEHYSVDAHLHARHLHRANADALNASLGHDTDHTRTFADTTDTPMSRRYDRGVKISQSSRARRRIANKEKLYEDTIVASGDATNSPQRRKGVQLGRDGPRRFMDHRHEEAHLLVGRENEHNAYNLVKGKSHSAQQNVTMHTTARLLGRRKSMAEGALTVTDEGSPQQHLQVDVPAWQKRGGGGYDKGGGSSGDLPQASDLPDAVVIPSKTPRSKRKKIRQLALANNKEAPSKRPSNEAFIQWGDEGGCVPSGRPTSSDHRLSPPSAWLLPKASAITSDPSWANTVANDHQRNSKSEQGTDDDSSAKKKKRKILVRVKRGKKKGAPQEGNAHNSTISSREDTPTNSNQKRRHHHRSTTAIPPSRRHDYATSSKARNVSFTNTTINSHTFSALTSSSSLSGDDEDKTADSSSLTNEEGNNSGAWRHRAAVGNATTAPTTYSESHLLSSKPNFIATMKEVLLAFLNYDGAAKPRPATLTAPAVPPPGDLFGSQVIPFIYRKFRLNPDVDWANLYERIDSDSKVEIYRRVCAKLGVSVDVSGDVTLVAPVVQYHCVPKAVRPKWVRSRAFTMAASVFGRSRDTVAWSVLGPGLVPLFSMLEPTIRFQRRLLRHVQGGPQSSDFEIEASRRLSESRQSRSVRLRHQLLHNMSGSQWGSSDDHSASLTTPRSREISPGSSARSNWETVVPRSAQVMSLPALLVSEPTGLFSSDEGGQLPLPSTASLPPALKSPHPSMNSSFLTFKEAPPTTGLDAPASGLRLAEEPLPKLHTSSADAAISNENEATTQPTHSHHHVKFKSVDVTNAAPGSRKGSLLEGPHVVGVPRSVTVVIPNVSAFEDEVDAPVGVDEQEVSFRQRLLDRASRNTNDYFAKRTRQPSVVVAEEGDANRSLGTYDSTPPTATLEGDNGRSCDMVAVSSGDNPLQASPPPPPPLMQIQISETIHTPTQLLDAMCVGLYPLGLPHLVWHVLQLSGSVDALEQVVAVRREALFEETNACVTDRMVFIQLLRRLAAVEFLSGNVGGALMYQGEALEHAEMLLSLQGNCFSPQMRLYTSELVAYQQQLTLDALAQQYYDKVHGFGSPTLQVLRSIAMEDDAFSMEAQQILQQQQLLLQSVMIRTISRHCEQDPLIAKDYLQLGVALFEVGYFIPAMEHMRRSHRLFGQLHGATHPLTLLAEANICVVSYAMHCREIQAIVRAQHGKDGDGDETEYQPHAVFPPLSPTANQQKSVSPEDEFKRIKSVLEKSLGTLGCIAAHPNASLDLLECFQEVRGQYVKLKRWINSELRAVRSITGRSLQGSRNGGGGGLSHLTSLNTSTNVTSDGGRFGTCLTEGEAAERDNPNSDLEANFSRSLEKPLTAASVVSGNRDSSASRASSSSVPPIPMSFFKGWWNRDKSDPKSASIDSPSEAVSARQMRPLAKLLRKICPQSLESQLSGRREEAERALVPFAFLRPHPPFRDMDE